MYSFFLSWSVIVMEKSEATKKKSEPALVPEWLKAASSGVNSSGGGSLHHFASSSQSGIFPLPFIYLIYFLLLYYVVFVPITQSRRQFEISPVSLVGCCFYCFPVAKSINFHGKV